MSLIIIAKLLGFVDFFVTSYGYINKEDKF